MTVIPLCPSCGEPLRANLAVSTGATMRCPACGETVATGAAKTSTTPAGQTKAPGGAITEQSVRSNLRHRLAAIANSLENLPSPPNEVAALGQVIKGIGDEVTAGQGPNGETLDYLALAQQLSFAPRLLRRNELAQLAEDVERIQVTLERLSAVTTSAQDSTPGEITDHQPVREDEGATYTLSSANKGATQNQEGARPTELHLILGGTGLLALVVAIVLWVAFRPSPDLPPPSPTAVPTAPTAPTKAPSAEPVGPDMKLFLDHLAAARLAIRSGDPQAALVSLNAAGDITRQRKALFDTGRECLSALVTTAERAMGNGAWQRADELLADAVDLSAELGLDPAAELDPSVMRLSSSPWTTTLVKPNGQQLGTLTNRPVSVATTSSGKIEGLLKSIASDSLTITVAHNVGGGELLVDKVVPLGQIESITYDAPIDARLTVEALERSGQLRARPDLVNPPN